MDFIYFLLFFLIAYFSRTRFYLSAIDPLKIIAITDSLAALSGIILSRTPAVPSKYILSIFLTLGSWWVTWFIFGHFYGTRYRLSCIVFLKRLSSVGKRTQSILTFTTLLALLILTSTALLTSNLADARILTYKQLRIVEAFITTFLPISCFWIIQRFSKHRNLNDALLLSLLVLIRLVSGGKTSIIFLAFPASWLLSINLIKFNTKRVIYVLFLVTIFMFAGTSISFSSYSNLSVYEVYINAISGFLNNYYLPFQEDMVSRVQIDSLVSYLVSPFTKVFFGDHYSTLNLGAQIQGSYYNVESISGPQPHWSIILSSARIFIPLNIITISIITFSSVIGSMILVISSKLFNKLPLMSSMPILFSLICYTPQAYYDFSLYIVALVSSFAISAIVSLFMALWAPRKFNVALDRGSV